MALEIKIAASTAAAIWLRERGVNLHCGDAVEVMARMPTESVDVIFADPPYFLSGSGSTCKSGKRAKVSKGEWDKPMEPEDQLEWTRAWLDQARHVLKPTGTIWICGTLHSVHSAGYALQLESYRLLNQVVWQKPNPPPNLGCRCFTHSHETLLWASKGTASRHHFEYHRMKATNGGKQMKDVWRFMAAGKLEKVHGGHPTQKPTELVLRCLRASMPNGGTVLDPFMGSGTTGVAAAMLPAQRWKFIGIEREQEWVDVASKRIRAEMGSSHPDREELSATSEDVPDRAEA